MKLCGSVFISYDLGLLSGVAHCGPTFPLAHVHSNVES